MFDLVITADWSAEQGRKPTPQENRCWLAWGTSAGDRSAPEYMPTRLEAERRILDLVTARFAGVRTLIGFDFAIGYPLADDGLPALPVGRELCRLMDHLVTDDASGVNNRFEVAGRLNQIVRQVTLAQHGPFWGRPRGLQIADLPELRPSGTGVAKLRRAELAAKAHASSKPKSPWQVAGIGSVGGQSIVGLKTVHRLLTSLGDRGRLWPFEPEPQAPGPVTIAEIYPSLYEQRSPGYWYKDARQVIDTRDAILNAEHDVLAAPEETLEGWIIGVKP